MIEWLAEYGMFLAKTATLVFALALVLALMARGRRRGGDSGSTGQLRVTSLDARFSGRQRQLQLAATPKSGRRQLAKRLKREEKQAAKAAVNERVWVLDFEGDLKASATPALSELISLLIAQLESGDEVVLRLTSGGGLVHSYGLAAAQLDRLRDAGARLTVCVDKVAASGGYMMACCAHHLIAAPFAVIGSIGVVAQIPNVHRLLKKHDVDVELLTAGRYKRTLTVLGENSEEGRAKFLEDLQSTHDLFKQYVGERRPQLDLEQVATGEIWYGSEALPQGLIDAVGTSDAYLLEKFSSQARVLHVSLTSRRGLAGRLAKGAEAGVERTLDRVLERLGRLGWERH